MRGCARSPLYEARATIVNTAYEERERLARDRWWRWYLFVSPIRMRQWKARKK